MKLCPVPLPCYLGIQWLYTYMHKWDWGQALSLSVHPSQPVKVKILFIKKHSENIYVSNLHNFQSPRNSHRIGGYIKDVVLNFHRGVGVEPENTFFGNRYGHFLEQKYHKFSQEILVSYICQSAFSRLVNCEKNNTQTKEEKKMQLG